MIIQRISKLHGRSRTRKCALLLERAELDIAEGRGWDKAKELALALAEFLASDTESEEGLKTAAGICVSSLAPAREPKLILRSINDFRHFLVRVSGQAPADWDLHDYRAPPGPAATAETSAEAGTARAAAAREGLGESRPFYPGLRVFLEDIRSPFNVGSILRTAEALGFEEVLLSPLCADPGHPRAARSSMGAVELMPWKRCELGELPAYGPLLALELGGSSISDFAFPPRGVLLLGSEELGLTRSALDLAGANRISIPMKGIKASLNVAVAFGIAAQAWIEASLLP
jgi:TrmH family RNA methyltransferase